MSDIGTAYVNIVPKAEGIKGMLTKQVEGAGDSAGSAGGASLVGKMKGVIAAAGIGAVVVAGIKKSIGEGAALQQSMGGIETLFKGSADTVIKNARQAFKTAGVSANEYMESVTSFSAGLINSLDGDTVKAAKVADMAMVDMSDNANKMGTDIGSIQNAYQGFAKQNYTMLDNLKLGYGGTKEEMARLLEDAGKISGQKYDMSNLSDVYEAIHVVQNELEITGTTAEEASSTISGSFGSLKAAFSDFMGSLTMGENVGESMKNLIDSAVTFLIGNLIPAIGNIMMSLPAAISSGINTAASYIPADLMGLLDTVLNTISSKLPAFLQKGTDIIMNIGTGLINKLPELINNATQVINKLANFIAKNYPKIMAAGIKLFMGLSKALVKNLPQILAAVGRLVLALGRALLKLAPLGLKAGLQFIKAIGSGIGNAISGVIGKVKGFVDKILAPIKGLVDKVRGIFPINLGNIFSGLKLPHFTVNGGKFPFGVAGKGSPPSWNVSWYAKGGIMDGPTLFGGGERGPEAIVPLDPFWKKLDKVGGSTFNVTMNVNGAEDPEAWADRFMSRLQMEARMA